MGLSSSQARLLSITARLTDNEYRTQRLTNARLKLTDISDAARVQYQNALDSDKFMFIAYDSTGTNTKYDLTPSVLYQYQPRKNQYALVNNANKVLVSATDAKNFKETDNLAEFLKRYDCLEKVANTETKITERTKEIENPEYLEWEEAHPPVNDVITDETLSQMFLDASYACYSHATNNRGADPSCYVHVLAHLLFLLEDEDYSTGSAFANDYYTEPPVTTTGDIPNKLYWEHGYHIDSAYIHDEGHSNEMIPLAIVLREGYQPEGADEKYTILASKLPMYEEIKDELPDESYKILSDYYIRQGTTDKNKILMSNYYKDENGSIRLKTLRQKCVDMFYLSNEFYINIENEYYRRKGQGEDITRAELLNTFEYNGLNYYRDMMPIIKTIQVDLKHFTLDIGESNPYPPTITVPLDPLIDTHTEEKIIIKDPEKAQWYTNLWYRMNGMDEPERIYKNSIETTNDRQEEVIENEYLLKLYDVHKQTAFTNYDEIDSRLMSSKDWLNNALSQGIVTMQKVGASRTTADDKFKWSSIIYTNATDIISQQDDTKIAIAEANYNQTLAEVNAKDKVFENKIRKLDTEHNALQTEYNSIKAAMDKNIERSFKAFQG